jgi:hypothetical protein
MKPRSLPVLLALVLLLITSPSDPPSSYEPSNNSLHTTSPHPGSAMARLLIPVLAAMAMIANVLIIPPSITWTSSMSLLKRTAFTRPYSHPIPRTDKDNTYTVEQIDQFREAHVDVMYMCSAVIE